jgi:ABC-type dipeptide/oligopeptide/nickel transport system permease subunit
VIENTPLIPWWIALPLGALVLIVLGGKLLVLGVVAMDEQRRRVRVACTVLMMLAAALFSYGVGVATPARPRMYVLVWVLTAALLMMIIMLAMLDLLHTARLHREQLRALRRRMAESRAEGARAAAEGRDA